MSQKMDNYNAYLAQWDRQHPDVVEPARSGWSDETTMRLWGEAEHTGRRLPGTKCYRGEGCVAYQMPDGRVVELGFSSSHTFRLAAEFPTYEAWKNYDTPMSLRVFYEEW